MPPAKAKEDDVGLEFGVEDSVPIRPRGKTHDKTTIAIRDELQRSVKDGKARSFADVSSEEGHDRNKEVFARKVRAAGTMLGIKVSTSFAPYEENGTLGKLYWGPADVVKTIKSRTAA